jgi:hypothetical protein
MAGFRTFLDTGLQERNLLDLVTSLQRATISIISKANAERDRAIELIKTS